jgi:hypothetical protein
VDEDDYEKHSKRKQMKKGRREWRGSYGEDADGKWVGRPGINYNLN